MGQAPADPAGSPNARHSADQSASQPSAHASAHAEGAPPSARSDAAAALEAEALRLSEQDEHLVLALAKRIVEDSRVRTHYYVKIVVSAFLCALLLLIGVPVFMESRVTGSLSYTALGVVLVGFGLILAVAVIVLLFRPPFGRR